MAVEEVVLSDGDLELTVLPSIGCRLHRLRAYGIDLLRTPPDPATHASDPYFWGAYLMAPWTNRATPGPRRIAGRTVDLPATFDDGTAIHGQVHRGPWERRGPSEFAIAHGGDGWPWPYEVSARIEIADAALRLAYRLTNRSDAPMPAGLGLHPWFIRPITIAARAGSVQPRNGDPDAAPVAATGSWALDGGEPPGGLDATWLGLDPGSVELHWPSAGLAATMTLATGADRVHLAVATPDEPDATAVEPVTHVPWGLDRLASGDPGAMRVLAPGEALDLEIGLAVRRGG